MDEQSKATLDAILANEPAALTEADIAFLRARRSYLTEEQKAVYKEALAEQPSQPNDFNATERDAADASRGSSELEPTETFETSKEIPTEVPKKAKKLKE